MTFILQTALEHGTENPIVARLMLQTHQLLEQCNVEKEIQNQILEIYFSSLQRRLLRCWEIGERFQKGFCSAQRAYESLIKSEQVVEIPHISRLDEECHNFLYETKNYIRD